MCQLNRSETLAGDGKDSKDENQYNIPSSFVPPWNYSGLSRYRSVATQNVLPTLVRFTQQRQRSECTNYFHLMIKGPGSRRRKSAIEPSTMTPCHRSQVHARMSNIPKSTQEWRLHSLPSSSESSAASPTPTCATINLSSSCEIKLRSNSPETSTEHKFTLRPKQLSFRWRQPDD